MTTNHVINFKSETSFTKYQDYYDQGMLTRISNDGIWHTVKMWLRKDSFLTLAKLVDIEWTCEFEDNSSDSSLSIESPPYNIISQELYNLYEENYICTVGVSGENAEEISQNIYDALVSKIGDVSETNEFLSGADNSNVHHQEL